MTHHYLCYYCIQNVDAAAATGESSSAAAAAAAAHIVVSDETIDSISSQLSKALDPATLEPHRINVEIEVGSRDRKSTRLNSSHPSRSRMPSSA